MELPFTTEQFLEVFRDYNHAIWPAQIAAYMFGLLPIILILRKKTYRGITVCSILGIFWIWTGGVYHMLFFSGINSAASLFGLIFVLQGALFTAVGNRLQFSFRVDAYGIVGAVMILYAMVIYPVLGSMLGHGYPEAPMFGVAPCPVTIFTFGILLWTAGRVPGWLLIIPGLWSLIGFTAAIKLGITEDIGLLAAGVVGVAMLIHKNRTGTSAHIRTAISN